MKPVIYGIKNCDTIKKARAWFAANGIDYEFHDYKLQGVDAARLQAWMAEVGWERLLNRAGTTFRKLPDSDREGLDQAKALKLMQAQPSMIRRPVVETAGGLLVGFDTGRFHATLLDG
jgi:arsenate reductase